MILRGAIVSLTPVRVVAVEERRTATPSRADPAPATSSAPAQAQAAAPPVDTRPKITAEAVIAWLAAQGTDARRAIAAALADEVDAEYAAARELGREEGAAEARDRAAAESAQHVQALERVATELRAVVERDGAALAASCCEIVLEVLKKIAGPLLAAPEAVTGAVAQVLQRLKDDQQVVVRVRPAELETLAAAKPALTRALAGGELTLVADQRVELGGCIVESGLGNLDGRLEVQLGELYEILRTAKAEGRKT
jgi:flagellar assembly protein FliH